LAAMEAMWETKPAPASLTLIGIPSAHEQKTKYAIDIPYLLGLIATRSFNTELEGIHQLVEEGKGKIRKGIVAYAALKELQAHPDNSKAKAELERTVDYLGYGLLLKRYHDPVVGASDEAIDKAAKSLEPSVAPLFYSFRIMVFCGFYFIFLFVYGFYLSTKRKLDTPWFLKMCLFSLPLPWVAAEFGWFVAEYGRQPWVVEGVLPTFMGVSHVTRSQVLTSITGFVVFYTALLIVEAYLMVKYIRLGPEKIKHG